MKKAFLLFGIIFLIVFSGCLQQDINSAAKKLPEIAAVFQEYPDAVMSSFFMRKDVTKLALVDIRADCGPDFASDSYWNVSVVSKGKLWEFYVDEGVTRVVCMIAPDLSNMPNPDDECSTAADCDDFEVSTKDECKGNPKKCIYATITECIDNDGYCPWNCNFENDNDCPEIDMCQSNYDCTDSNSFTKDVCEGVPKKCVYSLKTCEELGKKLCEVFEECRGNSLPTIDSGICCDGPCIKTKSCEGVVCKAEEKCVNGNCYEKSCAERELPLCVTGEICTENFYRDDFGVQCCTGECRMPCFSNADCEVGEKCDSEEDYCIAESCEDIGGKTCDSVIEKCAGDIERTLDNEECCLDCRIKKCEEMDGVFCDTEIGETCTSGTTTAFDGECCLAQCEIDPCYDRVCAINKKCEEGECVLKTCEEIGGIDWELSEDCEGFFYRSEGVLDCCIGFDCEEMSGIECQPGMVCSEDTILSTDVEKCCLGKCEETDSCFEKPCSPETVCQEDKTCRGTPHKAPDVYGIERCLEGYAGNNCDEHYEYNRPESFNKIGSVCYSIGDHFVEVDGVALCYQSWTPNVELEIVPLGNSNPSFYEVENSVCLEIGYRTAWSC